MTYATREEFLNAFIEGARAHFEAANAPLPSNVRVSVGFTSKGNRAGARKRIGECWSDTASGDGHFEIFIDPTITEVTRVCDVLTHELVHTAVGLEAGHNAHFKRVATSVGLVGPAPSTVAGEAWYAWANPLIESLGTMPYGAIMGGASTGRKKSKTALLKMECPACGWLARVTNKHIAPYSHLNCPVPECDGVLLCEAIDGPEDAE